MTDVPGILFVCAANRARSPLAELTARALLARYPGGSDVAVASAGTWTPGGEPMWPPAFAEAQRLGLDPSAFVSRQIADDVVEGVGVVLTATRALRDDVVSARPYLLGRAFTWRELARLLATVTPDWQGAPMGERPWLLPEFVAYYRGRVPPAAGHDLDVEDPAGRRPAVMREASEQTVAAVEVIVEALCRAG